MDNSNAINRRDFLGKTAKIAAGIGAAAVAMPSSRAFGANERPQLGIIGPGIRGYHLMGVVNDQTDAEIVAVCDIFDGWRERGIERAKQKAPNVKGYSHYQDLIENADIDGVIIATPEHSHTRMILDTIDAGLDTYLEKPMAHTWKEGLQVVKANEGGRIVIQVGTQRRSVDNYIIARDIIQSGGIGEVTAVRARWHRNSKSSDPQWRYPLPENATEETINWPEFLGDAEKVPFDVNRYFQWRCYWDYSNGPAGDLMVHQLDAVNIVMGGEMPRSAMGFGSINRFHELDRSTPDTWGAMIDFPGRPWAPSGYMVTYTCVFSNESDQNGEIFYGTNGTVETHEGFVKVIPERAEVADQVVEAMEQKSDMWGDAAHMQNFVECLKTRQTPNCPETNGHYASSAAHLAVLSHLKGERMEWDAEHNRVK